MLKNISNFLHIYLTETFIKTLQRPETFNGSFYSDSPLSKIQENFAGNLHYPNVHGFKIT